MEVAKIIVIVIGKILGAILGSLILTAICLWGLSYYVPNVFAFNWEHLLPLWCITFTVQNIFHNLVDVDLRKE